MRRLLARATTEGEREACEAALRRLLRDSAEQVSAGLDLHADLAELVAARQPLDGVLVRIIRRVGAEELQVAIEDYSWNPSEDVYTPKARRLQAPSEP